MFFAVHCNRLEMLDSLLKTNRLDLGIRDIVSCALMNAYNTNIAIYVVLQGGYTVLEYAEKNNPEAFSFLQKNHKDKFVRIPL